MSYDPNGGSYHQPHPSYAPPPQSSMTPSNTVPPSPVPYNYQYPPYQGAPQPPPSHYQQPCAAVPPQQVQHMQQPYSTPAPHPTYPAPVYQQPSPHHPYDNPVPYQSQQSGYQPAPSPVSSTQGYGQPPSHPSPPTGHYSQPMQQPPSNGYDKPSPSHHQQNHYAQPVQQLQQQPAPSHYAEPQSNYGRPPVYSNPSPPTQQRQPEYRNTAPSSQQQERQSEYHHRDQRPDAVPLTVPRHVESSPVDQYHGEERRRSTTQHPPPVDPRFKPIVDERRQAGFPSAFHPVEHHPQPVRPDPHYAVPTREERDRRREERGGGGENHYRENPLFQPGTRHDQRGSHRRDDVTPSEEDEENFRLSLLDRYIPPAVPDPRNSRRDNRDFPPSDNPYAPPLPSRHRSASPLDYWGRAKEAEWGTVRGLRQKVLSLLNSYTTVPDSDKLNKMMTVEFLITMMYSYENGYMLEKSPRGPNHPIEIFGIRGELTWFNFLRQMRDEGLIKIHEVKALAHRTYAVYAPHDTIASNGVVDPRPFRN